MKQFAACIFTLFLALLAMQPAMAEKRVALVIGNSAYEHTATLPNPKNDAKALTATLKRLGFEVLGGTDLTRRQFVKSVVKFSRQLRRADVGLFFYAGHGLQVSGQNYLVPIDAELSDEADLQFAMVKLNDVLAQMERSTKTNLIFIDACRDNPLARSLARAMGRTRSGNIGRGLAPVRTGIGTMITFATEPGNVAQDGKGKNSPFTTALLKHIETPELDIAPLLRSVRRDVIKETRGTQVPWNHSSLTNSFYFKKGQKIRQPRIQTSGTGRDRDYAFWQEVRGSKDTADYEDYLQQFPKGTFARRARRLQKKYEKRVAVRVFPSPRPEEHHRFTTGMIFNDCLICPSMVVIPKGSFLMGSRVNERGRDNDEDTRPKNGGKRKKIKIANHFAVSRYEIALAEFKVFARETDFIAGKKCFTNEGGKWKERSGRFFLQPGFDQKPFHPVTCISWNDAKAYTLWLSKKTGKEYRLLSEAEWEYAARAKTNTPFWWGKAISTRLANYDGNKIYGRGKKSRYRKRTVGVTSFKANPFGLYNVHGNVYEWVQDCSSPSLDEIPFDGNPYSYHNCDKRILRGGSWANYPRKLRSAARTSDFSVKRYSYVGFRVARSLPLPRTR